MAVLADFRGHQVLGIAFRVSRRARHHHLDRTLAEILAVPFRTQPDDQVIQVNADAAAHTDDHRLAVRRAGKQLLRGDQYIVVGMQAYGQ